MRTPEQQKEIAESIARILEATKSGTIKWSRVNPTTFAWSHASARVVIQRLEQSKQTLDPATKRPTVTKQTFFLFQVNPASTPTPILSVNSTEEGVNSTAIEELYKTAEENLSNQGIDLLKKILP